ncbi:MAG: transposase [Candidatus Auribacterota bacterium]|jgi:putative transposase|nr:transposase [Candidatus Auribacterota bacterium]
MPRQARVVIPHCPHHVTQRGNYRQAIFHEQADCDYYCHLIAAYSAKYRIKIYGYCLMLNHVHFIATPSSADALARFFNTAHMRYSQYINKKQQSVGHLWQGRFFSCVLDPEYLYDGVRYVEQNPIRAGLIEHAWDYYYSSAQEHTERGESPIPLEKTARFPDVSSWSDYLSVYDEQFFDDIRLKTHRGLIVGSPDFVRKMESRMHRSFICRSPGRPRKN